MTKNELTDKFNEAQAFVPGKKVRLDLGSEGSLLLDGTANRASSDDDDAETTIKATWEDWQQMLGGQLDGMTAFMQGKLKVEGDMSNAMQLQSVLGKLNG